MKTRSWTYVGLSRAGATVTLACCNLDKAEVARQRVVREAPGSQPRVLPLDLSDPRLERAYDRWGAYSHSKLVNRLFTAALHRRLADAGSLVTAVGQQPHGSAGVAAEWDDRDLLEDARRGPEGEGQE